jgi:hypothetical protein
VRERASEGGAFGLRLETVLEGRPVEWWTSVLIRK